MSKPVETSYQKLFEPELVTSVGKQNLKCSREHSFAVSFIHLELRRGHKEDCMEVVERSLTRLCALLRVASQGSAKVFQRCINLKAQK